MSVVAYVAGLGLVCLIAASAWMWGPWSLFGFGIGLLLVAFTWVKA